MFSARPDVRFAAVPEDVHAGRVAQSYRCKELVRCEFAGWPKHVIPL